MPATVPDGASSEMCISSEETFGPIVSIIRAHDIEFGSSAAVSGKGATRAIDVAERIDTGSMHINGATEVVRFV